MGWGGCGREWRGRREYGRAEKERRGTGGRSVFIVKKGNNRNERKRYCMSTLRGVEEQPITNNEGASAH